MAVPLQQQRREPAEAPAPLLPVALRLPGQLFPIFYISHRCGGISGRILSKTCSILLIPGPRRARRLPVLPGERAAVRPDHVAGSREIVPLVGVGFTAGRDESEIFWLRDFVQDECFTLERLQMSVSQKLTQSSILPLYSDRMKIE